MEGDFRTADQTITAASSFSPDIELHKRLAQAFIKSLQSNKNEVEKQKLEKLGIVQLFNVSLTQTTYEHELN
jgi:hypothetical protein